MRKSRVEILIIFGTRPEAIKFASLIEALKRSPDDFRVRVCVTAQHVDMLDQVMRFFGIRPDFDLRIMKPDQSLFDLTENSLKGLKSVIEKESPDLVFVQGDTTTAFAGALAGFYGGVKVAHLEAGLRSGEKSSPYPGEINRRLVDRIADYHFAPTKRALCNLNQEGIRDNIWVVGNTVIDSLFLCLEVMKHNGEQPYYHFFKNVDFSKRVILVTGPGRENSGKPCGDICGALRRIALHFEDIEIVYPVHPNPNVGKVVYRMLSGIRNIHLIKPLEYDFLVWLMNKSYFVLTDSGGIQEEAPSLGKPVLVMREVTERTEGIQTGTAKLIGTDQEQIVYGISTLLENRKEYERMARATNPYGDGKASTRIAQILSQYDIAEVGSFGRNEEAVHQIFSDPRCPIRAQ